jgi:hypothetical protein
MPFRLSAFSSSHGQNERKFIGHASLEPALSIKEKLHHFFDNGDTSLAAEWCSKTNQQPKPKLNSSVSIWLLLVCQAFHVKGLVANLFHLAE